jgi:PTH1 family peptidyl-tRNA hydrolase|tara:strand:+ start:606 stop:1256 length:651 start_codon:yes stop_codon:yes gene_type:complete
MLFLFLINQTHSLNWLEFFNLRSKPNIDMNKFLIVGIGNIGKEYFETRHNIGFEILDYVCKELNETFSTEKLGDIAKFKLKGKTLILLKPSTYVNLSGKSIRFWLQKENIPIENLLVISDDLNLDFGVIRIRTKGSDGGHNGLKNIQEVLNTTIYNRLRFGIGGNFSKGRQSDFVLSKWSKNEQSELITLKLLINQIIKNYVNSGVADTMNKFNSK